MKKILMVSFMVLVASGCANNPWGGDVARVSANDTDETVYLLSETNIDWVKLMESIAVDSAGEQKALIVDLSEEVSVTASIDSRFRLAFMLGFSTYKVRDEKKAMQLYDELERDAGVKTLSETMPRFANMLLSGLKDKKYEMYKLRRANRRLIQEKKDIKNSVKELERKLQAIKSIEESIHQRNR